jgi:hypothetical protein
MQFLHSCVILFVDTLEINGNLFLANVFAGDQLDTEMPVKTSWLCMLWRQKCVFGMLSSQPEFFQRKLSSCDICCSSRNIFVGDYTMCLEFISLEQTMLEECSSRHTVP